MDNIKISTRTTDEWEALNPILKKEEVGKDSITGKVALGNGYTRWSDLPSFSYLDNFDLSAVPAINSFRMADPSGILYLDDTGLFQARPGSRLVIVAKDPTAGTGVQFAQTVIHSGIGDNATFRGTGGAVYYASDLSGMTSGQRGVLYGLEANVQPSFDRNNSPYDDVVCLALFNSGTGKGTDMAYFGHRSDGGGTQQDFGQIIQIDAWGDTLFRANGHYTTGISLNGALISGPAIKLANAQTIQNLLADGSTLVTMLTLDTSNNYQIYAGKLAVLSGGGLRFTGVTTIPATPSANNVAVYSDAGVLKSRDPNGAFAALSAGSIETFGKRSGAIRETFSRIARPISSQSVLATGTMAFVAIPLLKGEVVSKITFLSGSTAAGATPANQWFGLWSPSWAQLAVTNDDTTTAWAANTEKQLTLANPYTATADGLYYLSCMVKDTTSVPTLAGISVRSSDMALAPVLCATDASNTGLTTPSTAPATATLTASASYLYAWVS